MRSILFVLFVCFLQAANATTYYFSAVSGDDSRTSNQARNSSTPWKSLSKLNAIFSSLQPGDAVLLKRDETFYGSIIVNKSGTSGSPVTIGAYGSGNKPVITSLVKLTSWVSKGNGIYESYNSSLGAAVKTVLINGAPQELGRFPNSDASNKGYSMFDAYSGTTSITDYDLKSTPNWTGAHLVIRSRRWIIDKNLITSHSGNKISYKATSQYAPHNKQGYFIVNSIKTLDKFGEWYYNSSTKKLSVYFGSNSPSSYFVQATTKDNLVSSAKFSNVVFDNLTVRGANASGFSIKFGSNMKINNCDVLFSGEFGISATFHPSFKVENSTISYSNFGGIFLGYSGDNAVIRNNKITNTYTFAGMGANGDSKGIGIFSFGNNSIIEYNQIINTGYIGISFNGDYVTIKNNFIDNFCITKDDGSGIYTYTGYVNTTRRGRKVIGNVIINGKGAWEGTSLPVHYMANGIYLDTGVSGVEVSDNTIGNCITQGIYLHNAHDIVIRNNTVFNSGQRQLSMIENANKPKIRNCPVTNSIFFSNDAKSKIVSRVSDDGNAALFGKFSGNYYARPLDDYALEFLQKIQSAEPNARLLSFVNPVRFEYNGTKVAKTISLNDNYTDVKNNKYSRSLTLQPFTSVVLIKSNISSAENSSLPIVDITRPALNTSFNTGESIIISAKATKNKGSISKVEFYEGSTLLNTQYAAPYGYSWRDAPAGKHKITAKAFDNNGHTTSKNVTISVAATSSNPKVSIKNPNHNSSYRAGATINISANASDAGGFIKKVEFYKGATLLTTQQYPPYSWNWKNVGAGNYTIIAKATDNSGHVTTSAGVHISVKKTSKKSSDGSDSLNIVSKSDTANSQLALSNKIDNLPFDFRLFPNPAVNTIKVSFNNTKFNQKAILSVQSISGSTLKSLSLILSGNTAEIDISSLPSGIYIMKLTGSNFAINKKFVKIN